MEEAQSGSGSYAITKNQARGDSDCFIFFARYDIC